MNAAGHIAVAAAYGMAAAGVGWGLPLVAAGVSGAEAVLAGAGMFVAAALAHEALARRRATDGVRRDMQKLQKAQAANTAKLERAERELASLRRALGVVNAESDADLIGEMRVIRSLLKKITDRSAASQEVRDGAAIPRAVAAERVAGRLSAEQILEITRAGLENNRVDLYLQSIVSLPQRKVRFYEVFSRIRNDAGNVIVPEQYLSLVEDSGMISALDNLLLFRCVQLVRRARRDNADVGVFVNLSAQALLDEEFFPQFLEFLERNAEMSESLVFEMSQVDAANPGVAANLGVLRRAGFAFSLDKVDSLDLDFDDLARRNFRFVKIEARKLLSQDVQQRMTIHMADLKEAMKRAGLELIAEKVEEEDEVLGLLDFNVDYGQGFLFGEPRPALDTPV
ncbi:MAG: EAL domain-containing protein [Proteobacteria bacterium]|nr:EAL domain-containing protein [Pseudomonadota bacterium]